MLPLWEVWSLDSNLLCQWTQSIRTKFQAKNQISGFSSKRETKREETMRPTQEIWTPADPRTYCRSDRRRQGRVLQVLQDGGFPDLSEGRKSLKVRSI
jgi:hypothetical protein